MEKFLGQHSSKPANPDIARTFYRAGFIEQWGRGIALILSECEAHGIPRPVFNIDFDGLDIVFKEKIKSTAQWVPVPDLPLLALKSNIDALKKTGMQAHFETEELTSLISIARTLEPPSLKLIMRLAKEGPSKRKELMDSVQLTNQTYNVKRYLEPLLNADLVIFTKADRPQSKHRQYLLTEDGRKMALLLQEALDDAKNRLS